MELAPEWLPREVYAPVTPSEHAAVRVAQRVLRLNPTGDMDEPTRASLRGLQRITKIPVTGILDAATAVEIDRLRPWRLGEE